jgi:hypothetical protein
MGLYGEAPMMIIHPEPERTIEGSAFPKRFSRGPYDWQSSVARMSEHACRQTRVIGNADFASSAATEKIAEGTALRT